MLKKVRLTVLLGASLAMGGLGLSTAGAAHAATLSSTSPPTMTCRDPYIDPDPVCPVVYLLCKSGCGAADGSASAAREAT